MEIPVWAINAVLGAAGAIALYVYKDMRAMMMEMAKITATMESMRERITRMDDRIEAISGAIMCPSVTQMASKANETNRCGH